MSIFHADRYPPFFDHKHLPMLTTFTVVLLRFYSSSCCRFDYAIGGEITTLDKASFEDRLKSPREGLGLLTILDDTSVEDGKEIEVAIRMRDCGRDCTFALTHVFWA